MHSKLNPYISFDGNAKEAMEFYHSALGGDLKMTTFKEGGMTEDPSAADKIMHAQLIADNGLILMGADTPSGMPYHAGNNISISLSGEDDTELRGYWDKLAVGAKIDMPLEVAPWGDIFGMFTDKFDIHWMVNITGNKQ